ncbi:MAG: transglycosylase domain-containing protein [Bdellovibrionota bacterium]
MITRRVVLITALVLFVVGFPLYLRSLYQQLDATFNQHEESLPTRIFSDVTRVVAPQPRSYIDERLKALGYTPETGDGTLTFKVHALDYPNYLIPNGHPTLDAVNQMVTLKFDGNDSGSLLTAIELGGKEIPDLYLEPELVATLSRAGETRREIRTLVRWNADPEKDKDFDKVYLPPMAWKAIVAIEDQHFMDHHGFDPKGLLRAILVDIRHLRFAQGGSTLTQQLVKNLMARHSKNIFKKLNELFLAILLETRFKKEQILERYLNEVYLGQVGNLEIHGVAEGAKHFFGKNLKDLNLAEIAFMAGLIRGPAYYSPYRYYNRALERQRMVLHKMVETGEIAEGEEQEALRLPIRLAPPQNAAMKAPYFTDFVKAELIRQLKTLKNLSEDEVTQAGFRVYTTLDSSLNTAAQKSVAEGITDLEGRYKLQASDRLEGALASVDQSTGYIRALIGGRNYGYSNFNRILNMKRQVGSTFKPIVYLTAISKGEDPNGITYGPGHPAEDAPWTLTYDKGKQTWTPRNYEKEFLGWINYRTALAHSVNTVTARVGFEVGIDNVVKMARAMGIESDLPAVPSLALGVAELSPIELLRVYATVANHGSQQELTVIRAIHHEDGSFFAKFSPNSKQPVDPGSADVLTDMLQSVFSEGTAKIASSAFHFDRPAAGKTGTTSHHRDAWFAGYTPQLTTVVWVGMDQSPIPVASPSPGVMGALDPGEEKTKVTLTGAGAALPIWTSFMKKAHLGIPPTGFPTSAYVENDTIDKHTGKSASLFCPAENTVVEKFIRGHGPRGSSCETMWPVSVPQTGAEF